ncbi:hypothetical protein NECAME_10354 [Necator americanus]|uniref:RING-type domain-containing protein n=1 Tax=Necator americanus TaxID=51031 RepID=W2T973_NECAM|nr:hypothetical protein NECAME_10354 [Necator americanus]ETN78408.1 hypothetical protein NECAME_10354 [Necator americanus]
MRGARILECPLCCMQQPSSNFPRLICCQHRSCRLCLMQVCTVINTFSSILIRTFLNYLGQYVEMEIMENRVEVSCPECAAHLHPSDIRSLVGGRRALIEKYEQFSLRRYLMTETDARWCPAPDCGYDIFSMDTNFGLRLYTAEQDDESGYSSTLVARGTTDLESFIVNLKTEDLGYAKNPNDNGKPGMLLLRRLVLHAHNSNVKERHVELSSAIIAK